MRPPYENAPTGLGRGAMQTKGRGLHRQYSADYRGLIGPVARELCGEPNLKESSQTELRFGTHGSLSVDLEKDTWYDHETEEGGGVLDLVTRYTGRKDGKRWMVERGYLRDEVPRSASPAAVYDYCDEDGEILFQVERRDGRKFLQRKPDGTYKVRGVRQVPYRLPDLLARPDELVFVVEGEKDADNMHAAGLLATCNAGGAGKWRSEHSQALQGRDVVILPDNDDPGRDHAEKVAQSLEGIARTIRVVELPGLPAKGDVSDWLAAGGTAEELVAMLPEVEAHPHPLAQIVPVGAQVEPPSWIIPGLIAEGVTVWSGMWGVGKTTALLPLAAAAAGLHEPEYPLAPKHWRHVIYVVEDVGQAGRIIHGLAWHLKITVEAVNERLHLVEAKRLDAVFLVTVGTYYLEQYARDVEGVALPPLVVLDTQAASINLENENDNAEASRAIAALKQEFSGLPVWLVGHVAKGITRKSLAEMSARGAGAFEADAHQTVYLIADEGDDPKRWLIPRKARFPLKWRELELEGHTATVTTMDKWGQPEDVPLIWAIARPSEQGREERAKQAREALAEAARAADELLVRDKIARTVGDAWEAGAPLNRQGVRSKVGGNGQALVATIEAMLTDGRLIEVEIPKAQRLHPRKSAFLVTLSAREREAYLATGELPATKLEIPPSWRKDDSGTDGNDRPDSEAPVEAVSIVPDSIVPLRENSRERMDGEKTPPSDSSCSEGVGMDENDRERMGMDEPREREPTP